MVLFVDESRGVLALGWVHGRCGPSAVYPLNQMDVLSAAHADTGQAGKRDEVYTTQVQIESSLFPTAHDDDDGAVFRAALASVSSADRLVGAVVSLNSPRWH